MLEVQSEYEKAQFQLQPDGGAAPERSSAEPRNHIDRVEKGRRGQEQDPFAPAVS